MWGYRNLLGRRATPGLLCLDEALAALGRDGDMGRRTAVVPLTDVVGTVHRSADFDHEFRLVNDRLQGRWDDLAAAVRSGFEPPPVTLVQLGDLYFVVDGHHRVSVARALGRHDIAARVHRICTVAYGLCRVRSSHLAVKAAERKFLERVPLPVDVRVGLWLDEPAEWTRLADAAEAWGLQRSRALGRLMDRCELADAWWAQEVRPVADRLRATGPHQDHRDSQLYMTALAARDQAGRGTWPAGADASARVSR